MYWSAVATFRNNPENTVDETNVSRLRTKRTKTEVMLPSIPPAVMAPPKHMAHNISHTVFIIPAMPRVATSSVSDSLDVVRLVLP